MSFYKLTYIIFFALFLSTYSCQEPPKAIDAPKRVIDTVKTTSEIKNLFLLFLKKENQIEYWDISESQASFIKTIEAKIPSTFPIGQFGLLLSKENTVKLDFPNPTYSRKLFTTSTLKNQHFYLDDNPKEKNTCILPNEAMGELQEILASNTIQCLVLPNDARKNGQLDACFACPHWMAEVYGQSALDLKIFQKEN